MASSRMLAWGAVGALVGGLGFLVGHVLGFLSEDVSAGAVTAGWLNLVGVTAMVFGVLGVHDVLRERAPGLSGAGTVLSVIGLVLLAGFFTLRVALAYELVDAAAVDAPEMAGLSAAANLAFLLGLALLGVALVRTGALYRLIGVVVLLAVATFVVGFAVPAGGLGGGLLLGGAFVATAVELLMRRLRLQVAG